jgi:hypothetical protein
LSPLSFAGVINGTLTGFAIGFFCISSRKAECAIVVLLAIVELRTAFPIA